MPDIIYIDRKSGQKEKELVYGRFFIDLLYGKGILSDFCFHFILPLIVKVPFFSKLYGAFQKSSCTRWKVGPFIRAFKVDETEFLDRVDSFKSFNAFFIRKLKKEARPMAADNEVAAMPADARYLVYQEMAQADDFWIKGKRFNLERLLQNGALAKRYEKGSMLIARLCPTDYHRFHFPCDGTPERAQRIDGPLYSVNPIALKRRIEIFWENKREITPFNTDAFGKILYIEVGAMYVGSICQTFKPGTPCRKGDEKGYFEFGGSSLILLFEPGKIVFDQDLIDASLQKIEVRGLLGQSFGKACR